MPTISTTNPTTATAADLLAEFTAEIHSAALKGGAGSDMPASAWKISNAGKTAQRKITLNLEALKGATALIVREISGAVYFKRATAAEIADPDTPTQSITWRGTLAVLSANKKLSRALGVESSDPSHPGDLYTYRVKTAAVDDDGAPLLWEMSSDPTTEDTTEESESADSTEDTTEDTTAPTAEESAEESAEGGEE